MRCAPGMVPAKIGSLALRRQGGAVVSLAKRVSFSATSRLADCQLIVDPELDKPANRINDGKVDKRGRFRRRLDGSSMEDGPNVRSLTVSILTFLLHKLDENIIVSNGPCWSPDGRIFYFTDTWTERNLGMADYDLETGAAVSSKGERSARLTVRAAEPRMCSTVDARGVPSWNALVYDGRIVRYTPDGKVDRVIEMPVKKVTSVMFGGPNLNILYVTSMAKPPLPRFPDDGVLRGSLFAVYDLGVRGVPEPRFAG